MRILLTEDNDELRQLLIETLVQAGHEVSGAQNGREAFALMLQRPFDLLVTDILMPETDGLELMSAFRRAHPQARIVAISGGGRAVDEALCLNLARHLGADAFLKKPFPLQDLVHAVQTAGASER